MSPGKCANCGATGRDRKYVDFGLTVELYGVVYICSICIGELFRLFNFEPVATNLKFKTMENHITVLETANGELEHVVHRLKDKLSNFRKEFTHVQSVVNSRPDPVSGNIDPDLVLNTSSDDVNNTVDESRAENDNTGTERTDTRTPEPATGSGRQNVPSLAELLKGGSVS